MTSISIPTGTDSCIRIPAKAKPTEQLERIGVSVRHAAKMLDLCERTVWTLIKDGKICSVRVGIRTIVSVQSLRDFVDGKKEPCDSMENSVESQGGKAVSR